MRTWIKWQQKRLPVRFDYMSGLPAERSWDESGRYPGREVVGEEMVQPCGTGLLDHVGFLHHSILFSFTDMSNGLSCHSLVKLDLYLDH